LVPQLPLFDQVSAPSSSRGDAARTAYEQKPTPARTEAGDGDDAQLWEADDRLVAAVLAEDVRNRVPRGGNVDVVAGRCGEEPGVRKGRRCASHLSSTRRPD